MEMDEVSAVGRFGKSPGGAVALTVVVEFESGGEGGAFEVGTAPEGSAELGRLVSDARHEGEALGAGPTGPPPAPRPPPRASFFGMPRAIPEPLRAKGRCPLEPWLR